MHMIRLFVSIVALASIALAKPSRAQVPTERSACPSFQALIDAKAQVESTKKALEGIQLDPLLEAKVIGLAINKLAQANGLGGAEAMTLERAFEAVKGELSAEETFEIGKYVLAVGAVNAAEDAERLALKQFAEEVRLAAEALAKAEEKFKEEEAWLEQERAALKGQPADDANLDRLLRLTARRKAAFEEMLRELGPFRHCSSAVDAFLRDKESRLRNIARLEAKIAALRGGRGWGGGSTAVGTGAGPTTSVAAAGAGTDGAGAGADPAKNLSGRPLGDTYRRIDPPAISPIYGVMKTAGPEGYRYEFDRNNQQGFGTLRVDSPPPATVRVNEVVTLKMTVSSEGPTLAFGKWMLESVVGDHVEAGFDPACRSTPDPNLKGGNTPVSAVRFEFSPRGDATIGFYGGEMGSTDVGVVWKYELVK